MDNLARKEKITIKNYGKKGSSLVGYGIVAGLISLGALFTITDLGKEVARILGDGSEAVAQGAEGPISFRITSFGAVNKARPGTIATSSVISWSGGGDHENPATSMKISLDNASGAASGGKAFVRIAGDGSAAAGPWVEGSLDIPRGKSFQIGLKTSGAEGDFSDGETGEVRFRTPDRQYVLTVNLEDSSPDTLVAALSDARPGDTITMPAVVANGFNTPVLLSASAGISEGDLTVSINGSADVDLAVQSPLVSPGDSVVFKTTAGMPGEEKSFDGTFGGGVFTVTLTAGTVIVDPFMIPARIDAAPLSETVSQRIVPTGFSIPVPISVSREDSSGDMTSPVIIFDNNTRATSGMLNPGEGFQIAMISGPDTGALRKARVSVGGWTGVGPSSDPAEAVWVLSAPDITPDDPGYGVTEGHEPGAYAQTEYVQITGISAPVFVRGATDGIEVSVDNGPWGDFATVPPFSTLAVRQNIPFDAVAGESYQAEILFGIEGPDATIPDPTLTATWIAEAAGTDIIPDAFVIPDVTNAEPFLARLSSTITPTGFDRRAQISAVGTGASAGKEIRIAIGNTEARVSTEENPVFIRPGQSFRVESDARDFEDSDTFEVRIGRVFGNNPAFTSSPWSLAARAVDTTPENYIVADISSPQAYLALVESETLRPTGFTEAIDVKITGPLADDVSVRANGGAWQSPDSGNGGLALVLNPGETLQFRLNVKRADGDPKEVTIQVGDTAPYIWTIPTIDMYPDPAAFPDFSDFVTNAQTFSQYSRQAGGVDWIMQVQGFGEGVSVKPQSGVRVYNSFEEANARSSTYQVNSMKNGDWIKFLFSASNGESRRIFLDIGGMRKEFNLTVNDTPAPPTNWVFPDVINAVASQRSYSDWIQPANYGADLSVTVTGGDPTTRLQIWRWGEPEPAKGVGESTAVTLIPRTDNRRLGGDKIRVSVMHGAGNNETRTSTINYGGFASRTTTWRSRNQIDDIVPELSGILDADGFNLTRLSENTVRGYGFTGFNGTFNTAITVSTQTTMISSPGDFINRTLLATPDNFSRLIYVGDPVVINPGSSGRIVLGGYATPGSIYDVKITLGHPTDTNLQIERTVHVTTQDEDRNPVVSGTDVSTTAQNEGSLIVSPESFIVSGLSSRGLITVRSEAVDGAAGAAFKVNNGEWLTSRTIIGDGDALSLRVQSGPAGESRAVRLIVEGWDTSGNLVETIRTFTVNTFDNIPDSVSFTDLNSVPMNAWTGSETVSVSGLDGLVPVAIAATGDGQALMEINDSGSRVPSGEVNNGDTIRLWVRTGANPNTTSGASLTIGGGDAATWNITTRPLDNTPNIFSFPDVNQAPEGDVIVSSRILPTGFLDAAAIVIVNAPPGLEISVADGVFNAAPSPAILFPGQSVKLRMTGPGVGGVATARISIGGVEGSWTVRGAVE